MPGVSFASCAAERDGGMRLDGDMSGGRVSSSRMSRHHMAPSGCLGPAGIKPPRPPCWRDFLPENTNNNTGSRAPSARSKKTKDKSDNLHLTDLTQLHKGMGHESVADTRQGLPCKSSPRGMESVAASKDFSRSGKVHSATLPTSLTNKSKDKSKKKHKTNLHRTRSEFSIEKAHLPEAEHMTVYLGDTKPGHGFGLPQGGRRDVADVRAYHDENTRRCALWLEGVYASGPLVDVQAAQDVALRVADVTKTRITRRSSDPLSDIDSVSVDQPQNGAATVSSRSRKGAKKRENDTSKGKPRQSFKGDKAIQSRNTKSRDYKVASSAPVEIGSTGGEETTQKRENHSLSRVSSHSDSLEQIETVVVRDEKENANSKRREEKEHDDVSLVQNNSPASPRLTLTKGSPPRAMVSRDVLGFVASGSGSDVGDKE